jgi:hypothetical protein
VRAHAASDSGKKSAPLLPFDATLVYQDPLLKDLTSYFSDLSGFPMCTVFMVKPYVSESQRVPALETLALAPILFGVAQGCAFRRKCSRDIRKRCLSV